MAQRLILPDFMGNFRHPAVQNPDYETCDISAKWLSSFNLFSPRAQRFFDIGEFGLLSRLAYPMARGEHFRICCDAINVFFAVDDIMDDSDPKTVRQIVAIIMDAFRDWETPRPKGEHIIGEVIRQLSERIAKNASPLTRQRWIDSYEYYLIGNIEESQDKITGTPYNVQSFMAIRERTIGCKPSYNLLEMGLHLPEEILEHPLVQQAHLASTRMVCLCNDILSYNKEQAIGSEFHNIVSIAMRQSNLSVQEAFNWTARYHAEIEAEYNEAYDKLASLMPLWGDQLDAETLQYVTGLGNWVRANYEWSYSTPRYFGSHAEQARRERWVHLLPKQAVFA